MIDYDKLHSYPKVGRGSGRTFDVIVECIGNALLSNECDIHLFVCGNRSNIPFLVNMMGHIALEMGVNFTMKLFDHSIYFDGHGVVKFVCDGTFSRLNRGMEYKIFPDNKSIYYERKILG